MFRILKNSRFACVLLIVLVSCLVFAVPKAKCGVGGMCEHPLLKEGDYVCSPNGETWQYIDGKFMYAMGELISTPGGFKFVQSESKEDKGKRLEEGDTVLTSLGAYKYTKGKMVKMSDWEVEGLDRPPTVPDPPQTVPDRPQTISYDNSKYCTFGGGTVPVSSVAKPMGVSTPKTPVEKGFENGKSVVTPDGHEYFCVNGKFKDINKGRGVEPAPEKIKLEEGDSIFNEEFDTTTVWEYTEGKYECVLTEKWDQTRGKWVPVEKEGKTPVAAKAGEKTTLRPPSVTVVKATKTVMEGGVAKTEAVPGALVKLNVPSPPLPVAGNKKVDTGYDKSPVQGMADENGIILIASDPIVSDPIVRDGLRSGLELNVDLTPKKSVIAKFACKVPGDSIVLADISPDLSFEDKSFNKCVLVWDSALVSDLPVIYARIEPPKSEEKTVNKLFKVSNVLTFEGTEPNPCRTKQGKPNDPYFFSSGSWKQDYDDQWAIKRVGFTADEKSAWNLVKEKAAPVIVAVIDTGLDWNHKDISWENIWINKGEIPDNGIDDDKNGYVDDVIGWNFIDRNNKPWDYDGHGTFVSGVIAAAQNNNSGIAGINPHARIMALKALNNFGHTRAFSLAKAVIYAADNGARVINISVGGKHLTKMEQAAVDHAYSKGAIIVVAAGNEGIDTKDYSPAGLDHVITVAATDINDKRTIYSNWGQAIDIAAPGMDVLGLRARRTDLMRDIPGVEYTPDLAYVGKDKRYYRASGTSFSAPIVAGTASLILSRYPELTNKDVERMLLQSAKDIEVPGRDQYTGFGLLDAGAALRADPKYYSIARIQKVQAVKEKGETCLEVMGSADGSDFKEASIDLGFGEKPDKWEQILKIKTIQKDGRLGLIPAKSFKYSGKWTVRLQVKDKKEKVRESRASVTIK